MGDYSRPYFYALRGGQRRREKVKFKLKKESARGGRNFFPSGNMLKRKNQTLNAGSDKKAEESD